MGMIANYQYISDSQLEELKKMNPKENEEYFDIIEEWNEKEETLLDIDKMWDVLHFVLTGVDSSAPIEGDALSEAIVGEVSIDSEEFIAYSSKERLPAIIDALEHFDIESALENFSMEKCKAAGLYPNIWDYEEETEEIMEEITDYLEGMKAFYKEVAAREGNVMVTIY
ncbi:MAG: YfbM family protein [Eubacteriales bacterium]|nr:YfbM family protein [Eubacteriales bacterium]